MSSADNVVTFPAADRSTRRLSGPAEAALVLRRRFRENGRAQRETFCHLARHTYRLVEELKKAFGKRSGKMNRAFGDLLKQKQRFILADQQEPGVLCQNPGNWERVLDRLAEELGRDPDRAFLDAIKGTTLMPEPEVNGFGREQWLGSFGELMQRLVRRLADSADYPAMATYLADSGLLVEDGSLLVCETQHDTIGVEEYGLYTPAALAGMPHVHGLNFRSRLDYPYEAADGSLTELMKAAALDPALATDEPSAVLRGGTRTVLAFVIDSATKAPTFALAEWEVLELVFQYQTDRERACPIFKTYEEIGCAAGPTGMLPPNSVRFNLLGSPAFNALAASQIVFPEIWLDRLDFQVWDPGGYVDTVKEYPTEAPSRTVAAVVERNLTYASPDDADRRIDTMLLAQLDGLRALVDAHRTSTVPLARLARQALLAEWEAAARRQDR